MAKADASKPNTQLRPSLPGKRSARTCGSQQANYRSVAPPRCQDTGRPAVCVLHIHRRSVLNQRLHCRSVAVECRAVQRSRAVAIAVIRTCACLKQSMHSSGVSAGSCQHQRRAAGAVPQVGVPRACCQQSAQQRQQAAAHGEGERAVWAGRRFGRKLSKLLRWLEAISG